MKFSSFCLATFLLYISYGQNIEVDRLAQKIAIRFDENVNYERLIEQIQDLLNDPVILNRAEEQQLKSIWFLSPMQIREIIDYRENVGFQSVYELQNLESIDLETIELIMPFLKIINSESPLNKTDLERLHTHSLLLRYDAVLQTKNGFRKPGSTQKFIGSPGRLILRYRIKKNRRLSAGINLEKDEGEVLFSKKGFDHMNFHILIERPSAIRKVLIGDYRLEFGQALVLGGAGFNTGKGIDPIIGIKRNDVGIKPHHSITEWGFFRGIACEMEIGDTKTTVFGSWRALDAGIENHPETKFITIRTTGLHRTDSEISGKSTLRELVSGINTDYQIFRNLKVGVNGIYTHFSMPINPKPRLYNQFYFKGTSLLNLGFHFDYVWENMNIFGEIATDLKSQDPAWNIGALLNLTDKIELSIHLREYPEQFQTLHGNAFSEKSRLQNEKGIYMGVQYKISSRNRANFFVDQFIFPWLTSSISRPDHGHELGFQWEHSASKKLRIVFRYGWKNSAINHQETYPLPKINRQSIQSLKLFIQNDASENLSLRTRLQISKLKEAYGVLIAQDLVLKVFKNLQINSRVSLFDTKDHNTRQYVYENDVLYAFSIPSFSGIGIRNYLILRYKPLRKFTFWVKYSNTRYRDRNVIGQGVDEIRGNQKSELRLQIRYNLR